MSGIRLSPFQERIKQFLGCSNSHARDVQRAFVEALKEEVEARYRATGESNPATIGRPLVIAGLGSFKMKTRPQRAFDSFTYAPNQSVFGNDGPRPRVTKPAARRLAFTAKWEPIK